MGMRHYKVVSYQTAAAFFFLVTVTIKRPLTAGIRWGSSLSCRSSSGSKRSLARGVDIVCYGMESSSWINDIAVGVQGLNMLGVAQDGRENDKTLGRKLTAIGMWNFTVGSCCALKCGVGISYARRTPRLAQILYGSWERDSCHSNTCLYYSWFNYVSLRIYQSMGIIGGGDEVLGNH